MERTRIDVTSATFLRALGFALACVVAWKVRDVVVALLLAVVIASALDPAVRRLGKWKVPRVLAVSLLYIALLFGLLISTYTLLPKISAELDVFSKQTPKMLREARVDIAHRASWFPVDPVFDRIGAYLKGQDFTVKGFAGSLLSSENFFDRVVTFGMIFVVSFYMTVQERGVEKFLRLVIPGEYEDRVVYIWARTQRKIERWLQGQLLLALIVGVLVYIGLLGIFGLKYALSLAVISALFEIVPYIGPVLAAIPGVVFAALQLGPTTGLFVALYYTLVQQIEGHLIYPLVVQRMVGVSPIIAIVAILVGGKLGGIAGVILAIPLVVLLTEVLDERASRKSILENNGK